MSECTRAVTNGDGWPAGAGLSGSGDRAAGPQEQRGQDREGDGGQEVRVAGQQPQRPAISPLLVVRGNPPDGGGPEQDGYSECPPPSAPRPVGSQRQPADDRQDPDVV